jgi:hypothetical protein
MDQSRDSIDNLPSDLPPALAFDKDEMAESLSFGDALRWIFKQCVHIYFDVEIW